MRPVWLGKTSALFVSHSFRNALLCLACVGTVRASSGALPDGSQASASDARQEDTNAQLPRYTGGVQGSASSAHDGKLRWVVGVQNVQVVRSAPDNPDQTDGSSTLYRHHPFIAYWGGWFWVMHDGGGARVSWSTNGLEWSPTDSSPIFSETSHHRMAFYVASNGRFLASHWLGDRKGGLGNRLVREIDGPNSYGPEYSIKANDSGPYPQKTFEDWSSSPDEGFKVACKELLNNRLFCQQWQEEDCKSASSYTIGDGTEQWKAFSWYRLPDRRIVGSWKGVYCASSSGSDWVPGAVSAPTKVDSFGYNPGAKTWGARTEDSLYAMVGCVPGDVIRRRYPLAVTTSSDGLDFATPHWVIAGDVPPQRYENAVGDDKNSGAQYVRGICPGNGDPPGSDLWLTYSMNKEDIWVASVPVPIHERVPQDVRDDFQGQNPGRLVPGWNTYSPQWAPVSIVDEGTHRFLRLEDRDPVDYASVQRVFPEGTRADLSFKIRPSQNSDDPVFEMDVLSGNGDRAVALGFDPKTDDITAYEGTTRQSVASYRPGDWTEIDIQIFCKTQKYSLSVNGARVLKDASFLESTPTVERIAFRTGAFRLRDYARRPYEDGTWLTDRIPEADVMRNPSRYDIDDVLLLSESRGERKGE